MEKRTQRQNHLREWMRRTGTTQTALAREIGCDQSTVSRLVNSEHPVCTLAVAVAIAKITGLSIDDLAKLGRKGART